MISALFLAEGSVSGGLSASTGPARPTDINYRTQGAATDTRNAVGNHISPVDNSFEAAQPVQLTQANLKYHDSLSPAVMGILKHHFDHEHSAKDLTNDHLVEESRSYRSDTDHDDWSFIPGVGVDEHPLQDPNATGPDLFSDHRSSLSDWDRSFNRFSPGTSAGLRGVGANIQPHYFTYGPLPLLEHRNRRPSVEAQCICYD